eukprot:TRINITY_DN7873_c0_g2_i4.p1 TRINITY_DN7873_c0_g2~~TRINITY_DN7873_c0_g2_i4.p1  ORF type:complete len:687 (-),score=130.23 TRINITY_DN7873_c0_g2_i4:40-2100(-)
MGIYGNIPFVTAVHRWGDRPATASGFLFVNPSEGFVQVDSPTCAEDCRADTPTWWLFESGVIDIFSFSGPTPEDVLQQYHTVTGMPRMPPLFAMGKHQSRWNYVDIEDVEEVNRKFDQHRIPYDVLWLDLEHTDGKRYFTWDPRHFKEPTVMLDALARTGRKVVTIIDPHLKGDSDFVPFTRMQKANLLTKLPNGTDYEGFCWPGPSYYPDFCNPATQTEWSSFFDESVYPHSRPDLYTWNDMNEPSVFNGPEISMPRDILHKCHTSSYEIEHRDVHNMYGSYVHKASVMGQLRRAPNQRPFVLTRAFFAGSHQHGPVWTGDNMADWKHLAKSVPMLVSLALCGYSYAGADVGGFMGDPEPELLLRWHQLGIWYPFYRAHAHLTTKRREPWLFGEQATARIRSAVSTRYQLLPMWYTLAAEWSIFGTPMLRPPWYLNLDDDAAYKAADDHMMVGDALLVRAVTKTTRAKQVSVYLPSGKWFDFWHRDSAALAGGRSTDVPTHADHIPVFVQQGTILPMKMRPRRSTQPMLSDPYTLVVYGSPAKGRVYADDGNSHEFQQGAFIYEEFEFDGATLRSSSKADAVLGALRRSGKGSAALPETATIPSVPRTGLRVERIVFTGLGSRPTAASLRSCADGLGKGACDDRSLSFELEGSEGSWVAIVKNPAMLLGQETGKWSLDLTFATAS